MPSTHSRPSCAWPITISTQVWRELPALRDLERFEAWLHRILVNAFYAEARRNRRFAANVVLLETDEPAAGDEYLTVHAETSWTEVSGGFRRNSGPFSCSITPSG
jgi:hypothetical protein